LVRILRYFKLYDYPVPALAIGMKNNTIIAVSRSNTTQHGADNNAKTSIFKSLNRGVSFSKVNEIDVSGLDEMRTGHRLFVNPNTGMFLLVSDLYDATNTVHKGCKIYEIDEEGVAYERLTINFQGYAYPLFVVKVGDYYYLYLGQMLSNTTPWSWKIIRVNLFNWSYEEVIDLSTDLNNVAHNPNEASALLINNKVYLFIRFERDLNDNSYVAVRLFTLDFDPDTGALSNLQYVGIVGDKVTGSPTGVINIPNTKIAYLICYSYQVLEENYTKLKKINLDNGEVIVEYTLNIENHVGDEAGNGAIILVDPSIETSNGKYVAYAVYENGVEGQSGDYDGNFFVAIELDEEVPKEEVAPTPAPTYETYMASMSNMMVLMLIVMLIVELIRTIKVK